MRLSGGLDDGCHLIDRLLPRFVPLGGGQAMKPKALSGLPSGRWLLLQHCSSASGHVAMKDMVDAEASQDAVLHHMSRLLT